MIARLASALVLIPLVLLVIYYAPFPFFILLLDFVLVLALLELFRLFTHYRVRGYGVTFVLALLLPWTWTDPIAAPFPALLISALVVLSWSVIFTREMKAGLARASANLLTLLYLGVPVAIAAFLQQTARVELLLVLVVTWSGDSAAFFAGKLWGKHKVTPIVSPKKSFEGYVAGVAACAMVAVVYGFFFFPQWSPLYLGLSGLLLGVAGIFGDLFESMLKRGAEVKDSSDLIPGHGGVLDRVDSLLFALPFYWAWATLLQ